MAPLRILYQHRTLGDGAEGIHIIEMVKALRRLGHDVQIDGAEVTSSRSQTQRPSLVSTVRQALPAWGFEAAQFVTSGGTYAPIRRRIAAYKPDFIYKRHAKYDFGTVAAARQSGIPLILEVNCVYSAPSLRRYEPASFPASLERVERWIFDHSDENIVVSTALKHELHAVAPKASAVVMSNGVDHRLFVPDPAAGATVRRRLGFGNEVVVGFVGTLWKWHGLDLLLEAFTRIARNGQVKLLIVGDGEMREPLRELSQARSLQDHVVFTGRVPHEQVAGHVAAMDVTVLPAEHRSHASPMKVIEYMAAGKPVVAPRLPNLQEILTDGVDGLLFAEKDAGALADAIGRVSSDQALRQRLGAAARAKVEHELNWDSNARKVIEIYERVCRKRQ
jgi:glycosyltransferase involved in cell wall biosynthesis